MCELQIEYSRQGKKKKKERKIFMLCIDCSVVLFYNINDDSTIHFATIW